jgi:DNA-directed RNA polymerase specialized sigma24 family protein
MNPSGSDTVRAVTSSSGGLEELYARHVPSAVILARLLTGEAAAAEDIAHEGFIRAAGRFEHLRDVSNFDAYLRRTVVNLCHARGRSLVRERAALRRARAIPPATHDATLRRRRGLVSDPRLPFRQRAAVVLRY